MPDHFTHATIFLNNTEPYDWKDKIEKRKAGERKSSCKAFLLNIIKAIYYIYLTGFHNLFKLTYELTYPSEKSLKFQDFSGNQF